MVTHNYRKVEINGDLAAYGIDYHPGYDTPFCNRQAEGAWPNGTVVEKVNSEPGDGTPNGHIGVVMGSIKNPGIPQYAHIQHLYFVEWDDNPGMVIGCIDTKLAKR